MILYTMVPEELIFPQVPEQSSRQIIDRSGVSLEVEQDGSEFRVIRLLSTNPADFLDEKWMPGSKFSI